MGSNTDISLAWNGCTHSDWGALLCRAGRSPLEQSWAYGEAMVHEYGQTVDRIVFRRGDEPVAALQVFHKRLMGLASVVRIVRGPLFLEEPTDRLRFDIYRAVHGIYRFRRWEIPLWLPEEPDAPASHRLMRRVGTRRMVTGLSSAWLDLTSDDDALRGRMTGSWRNALRSAEKNGTAVSVEDNAHDLPRLMEEYDAFRRGKRFIGPPGRFVMAMNEAAATNRDVLALGAHAGGKRIAGIVLIRHGLSATYFIGWTSEAGRRHNAHNLLLWHGIRTLKTSETAWLDLGGLNTAAAAGIARFKLGLRPEPFTLAGTYL